MLIIRDKLERSWEIKGLALYKVDLRDKILLKGIMKGDESWIREGKAYNNQSNITLVKLT